MALGFPRSVANLMKVLEAEPSAPESTGPILAASKHWDYIFESRDYNAHTESFKNGYLRVSNWKYKAGSIDPDGKIMKATMVALLEKLVADGALHSNQIYQQTVHSQNSDNLLCCYCGEWCGRHRQVQCRH